MSCFQNASKSHKSIVKKHRHIRKSQVTNNVNNMSAKLSFCTESVHPNFNLFQTQLCYINPITLLYRGFLFGNINTNSQFFQPPAIQLIAMQKKKKVKHSKDAKRGIGKRKRVLILQYNQEHLCWNSLTPLSRQLHICNILMRQGEKNESRWLTVQIGKHNKTFKVPHFLTQAFDYPVSLLDLMISLYFWLYNVFV